LLKPSSFWHLSEKEHERHELCEEVKPGSYGSGRVRPDRFGFGPELSQILWAMQWAVWPGTADDVECKRSIALCRGRRTYPRESGRPLLLRCKQIEKFPSSCRNS
jgi:hypothetical protein